MISIEDIISDLGGQEKLQKRLTANLSWIEKSFENNNLKGSSGSRSLLGKWSASYPETTGYLLPTVLAASSIPKHRRLEIANSQYGYFKNLANSDGSFCQSESNSAPIIFDTAQILLGLINLVPYAPNNTAVSDLCEKSYNWLFNQLDNEGFFKEYNYIEGYNPSYYSRVAWPMLKWELSLNRHASKKTLKLISRIVAEKKPNYAFNNWGFYPETKAYTHTIAYTLRGLWECGSLLSDTDLKRVVYNSLDKILELVSTEGKLAGEYNGEWKGNYDFICSTGNAQLALLLILVYKNTKERKYLSGVPVLLKPLIRAQERFHSRGALSSSIPIWGPYQKLRYTNWTQKFYSECLIELLSLSS